MISRFVGGSEIMNKEYRLTIEIDKEHLAYEDSE